MAKIQSAIKESQAYNPNSRVFEAKEKRRLEKGLYSPLREMEIVKKLRDISRALKTAKLIKKGIVIKD